MKQKDYHGYRVHGETVVVIHDGGPNGGGLLPLRLDLREHSPTGFEWGYHGSGPAQLALALLADAVGDELALHWYQRFKQDVVAAFGPSWKVSNLDIARVVQGYQKRWSRKEAPHV